MMHNRMKQQCPYLQNDQAVNCKMAVDGLYVPMPSHIALFCRSEEHLKCSQYKKSEELMRRAEANSVSGPADRRRKHTRFKENLPLVVGESWNSDHTGGGIKFEARTVDMSIGGIQFFISEKLNLQQEMSFSWANQSFVSSLVGRGKIKWIKEHKDRQGFVAGMNFTDQSGISLVGKRLCKIKSNK